MELVTFEVIGNVYNFLSREITEIDMYFFRGLAFLVLWTFIILICGLFILSFFVMWWVGVGIIVILMLMEGITAIGRKI
ncbi:MAG: hypothetical protein Q7J54_06775 [Candidatus Woesearchaeota archaeon]|nr:hypothetical protein [Candidatus Woesearchaeota archaeon]